MQRVKQRQTLTLCLNPAKPPLWIHMRDGVFLKCIFTWGSGGSLKGWAVMFFPLLPFRSGAGFYLGGRHESSCLCQRHLRRWIQVAVPEIAPVVWGQFDGVIFMVLQFGLRLQGLHQGLPLTQDSCTITLPCARENKTSKKKKDSKTADVLSVNLLTALWVCCHPAIPV